MKNKFFKLLSLVITAVIVSIPCVHAGGFVSKPTTSEFPAKMQPYIKIVSNPANFPWYAADGGRDYYNAWHHIDEEAFERFLREYSNIIDNTTSATTLSDSVKDDRWHSLSASGNAFEFLTFEYPDTAFSSKFLVRVDAENRIIYTIRKSGDEYLCKFYFACRHTGSKDVVVCLSYNWIVNNESPVKNILLPVDRALLD